MNHTPAYKSVNQIYRDLMGVNSLNPWDGYDSSSRKQMVAGHIGQALVVKGSTERFHQTGMEREYAKYTFSIKMPCDGEILKIIRRYDSKIGVDEIKFSPQTIVIYENYHTKEIGMINIPTYCSYHQYFGFEYKACPPLGDVRVHSYIPEGTILCDSPSVTEDGGYKYGVECNIAFMSHPAVSEDGIMISRDVLQKFAFKTYETRIVEWGSKRFPLNIYGTVDNFKPFPDIGDTIQDSGLLAVLRQYHKELAVVEQGIYDLMEPDYTYDKQIYAAGGGGRVVDIRVEHDNQSKQSQSPTGMEDQADKYDRSRRQFHQEIADEYHRLYAKRGNTLQLTKELQSLVVRSLVVVDADPQRIIKLHRQAPLDDWRLEFVIEYDIVPTIGFKLTDLHGGKGVICKIAEPWEMPVDEHGNRADVVMDGGSRISRMNLGGLYEQYSNAARRDVLKDVCKMLGVNHGDKGLEPYLNQMEREEPERINKAWEYLLGYYQIISPTKMYVWFTDGEYNQSRITHLSRIIASNIYLYTPPENDPEWPDIIRELEARYRPVYGPVTYVGNSGQKITTKKPVRIGSVYMILLEKIGDDWTAVSSGKTQHYGVLSQVTNADKHSQPSRNQAIRAIGESEARIYISYAGTYVTADILDRNNNPVTHKQILYSILQAPKPTDIILAVNRKEIPLGGAKPLQLVKHIAECGGWKFMYADHIPYYGQTPVEA